MRIWHEQLIPILCRQHLLAMWREGLGCYKIVTHHLEGYRRHPAVIEFEDAPGLLYDRLEKVREEMLRRGYKPKELPQRVSFPAETLKEWQTLEEQIEILQAKNCPCRV